MEGAEKKSDVFKLSRDILSIQEVVDTVSSTSCGAISIFLGTTRDSFEGRRVIGLEYEAYEAMVQSELGKLSADIRTRWPTVTHVCIHHRLGWVGAGEASVAIAMSSPHRHDAQQAVQYCINQLKANVPIWKKEVYAGDEEGSWKENKECAWGRAKEAGGEGGEGGT
ncbi:molybdopterin synthase catalytic subunit [Centroberyx gerrardi]